MSEEFNSLMASDSTNGLQVSELSEFIKDRLYLILLTNQKDSTFIQSFKNWKESVKKNNVFYLNVDENLVYDGFYSDFGPLNLAMVYRYIGIIRDKLKTYEKVVHCTHRGDPKKRANAAFLICAYMVIEEDWTAYQAYSILSQQNKYKYLSFRDASCLVNTEYSVTVEDCINALYKAKWYGFLNFNDFNVDEYEKYETVKFGDINWIVPCTLLAFSSPHSRDYIDKSGYQIHSPAYYYKYFKENNVKHVIRLNSKKTYDAKQTFVAVANIQHTDMVFTDGTPPTDTILQSFLSVCEQYIDTNDNSESECKNETEESSIISTNSNICNGKCEGAVAVHCKAGLGRTGCLIASYIMKHWPFTAVEAIAWIRICRPGSVIGAQQQWLLDKEEYLKTIGIQWRESRKLSLDKYRRFMYGVYSDKRNTSNYNIYDYIDPPSQTSISNIYKLSCNISIDFDLKHAQSKEHKQNKCSSTLKSKLKRSIHVSKDQSDLHIPNLRQKRSASKTNDDPKLKNTIKNRVIITPNEKNMNMTKNTISITKKNVKVSVAGKKNIKGISLNKTATIKISSRSETPLIKADESKPSYTLATVASTARSSRRLRNQN